MFRKRETDVLVVGAGPVGQVTAMLLADRGVGVQIVDKERRTAGRSYALALHPFSLSLLHKLEIVDEVLKEGYRVDKVAFYQDKQRKAELSLSELPSSYPFVLVLPQSSLESILERHLDQRKIPVQWNHRVSRLIPGKDRVAADIDRLEQVSVGYSVATVEWVIDKTFHTEARFVIGADGHTSIVRSLLGAEYQTTSEPALFAVYEFDCEEDLGGEVRVVLDDETTNVLWPLPGGRARWSFQLTGEQAERGRLIEGRLAVQLGGRAFPMLAEETLSELIQARAPWFSARIGEVHWSVAVRFDHQLTDRYGKDRLWLVGDSAHLTGPAGAQSMNVGFREADELSRLISDVIRGETSIDALAGYERHWLSEWRQLLGFEGGLAAAEAGPAVDPWITQRQARLLPCLPASGAEFDRLVSQIGLRVEKK
ncbi:MAG: FAD-dependent monooxygenase [Acidobacteriota bacterium]|nr:MAG: FAD-dependent monooxygenase [Acidobacteriota bacterium]